MGTVQFTLCDLIKKTYISEGQVSGDRCQVSSVRCQLSGVRYLVSGIRCQVSGVWCKVSGVRCHNFFLYQGGLPCLVVVQLSK